MDAVRAIQLLTDIAYLALGIAAVAAAVRSHQRARLDVAILFGALGIAVALQEIPRLACGTITRCFTVPLSDTLATLLVLVVPYALVRLVDDVVDLSPWQMWVSPLVSIALGVAFVLAFGDPPPWLVLVMTLYLIFGTAYAAWAFGRRARLAYGITRRRMAAIAWGCGLLAAALVLGVIESASPQADPVLTPLTRICALISGLCFWAGFFPPNWLSQTWRLPELLGYLRPTRLMVGPQGQGVATEAMAIDRLCAATAATTGARRVLLVLEDTKHNDFYIWGSPTVRIAPDHPLMQRVMAMHEPFVLDEVTAGKLPETIAATFTAETLPRTAILAPVAGDGNNIGVLAAFAEKGPMFVEDDREVLDFFSGEAAVILRMQQFRQTANELEVLREADRLKDEFMAVVSHELRTPLTAITGYADILLRKLSGPLNERQERQITGVRDAARRLLALINDLLDVSKLEAGTLELHMAAIDPRSAIERAAASVRVIGVNKGVSLLVKDGDGEIPPVWADDERLQQILSNLLMNAIKFTPEGGSVWISAESRLSADQTEVVFRVQDTGVGLAAGQVSRVWERFYQAESSSTRRFGGAGLGLSIVRRLSELHGGRVEASSAGPNLGSTFAVYLPAAQAGEPVIRPTPTYSEPLMARANDAASDPPNPNALLVLVVEDDPHIANVLRTYLEADGYRVEIAQDGQEALQLARGLRPFAITLDISLPKLDGWSVLNVLKREPATCDIPVVIVSIVDNRDFGLVLGARDYLVKPIDPERLRNALRGLNGIQRQGAGTIVVVDDDPALRDVLGSLLAEDGWQVKTAADGEEALELVMRERPTAVVLDLMMPRIDGFEVLRTLRAQPTTRDLPVIVVTAKELSDEDRLRLSRNAQRVILKQATPLDDLRREIQSLLVTRSADNGSNGTAEGG